jgi:chemotaxis signal transduction protein
MHTVLMPVHADTYAWPIECVREVLASPKVTPLATAPPAVLGLINLRGEIVPLLDTASLLGLGTVDAALFAIVVNTPLGPAALAVTGFPERAELNERIGRSELRGTAATYRLNQRVVVVLDPDVLLDPDGSGGPEIHALSHNSGSS